MAVSVRIAVIATIILLWPGALARSKPAPEPNEIAKLVGQLRERCCQIVTFESADVTVVATIEGKRLPGLVGFLTLRAPDSLRLTGEAVATQYIDLGSNEKRTWAWLKDGDSPLYFCRREALRRGVGTSKESTSAEALLNLPQVLQNIISPKLDPTKRYRIESKENEIRLIDDTETGREGVRDVYIFNTEEPREAKIVGYSIENAKSGEVCWKASIKMTRTNRETKLAYPSDIVAEIPSGLIRINLKIGKATMNGRFTEQESSRYFTLPQFPGTKNVELGKKPQAAGR